MQLSVRDLIKLLNVDEATVLRWIKQRRLPAQHVLGHYHVNRAELLEWATANNVKVSLELFDHLDAEAETIPSLCDALEAGGIHYQLQDTSREQALRALVQILPLPKNVDPSAVLHFFLAREASASTAIGDGIAIPHLRNPVVLHVERPTITLAFLAKAVEFGALDGKPVNILFAIISPTIRCHLQLLSRLAFALHDGKFRDALVRQAPPAEIFKEIRRVEAGMVTPAIASNKGTS